MEKTYHPQHLEPRHTQAWEDSAQFHARAGADKKTAYSITLPPPNITGTLHMGHAFQVTIMDCLCRYHRMRGHSVLWQPGIDHAGIATQMVVERQLEKHHKTRQQLGRKQFIDEVWKWKQQSGGTIKKQLHRLGASLDWSRERFTMDPSISQTVTRVFVDLYQKGLVYRGKRLINWDPKLKTAISDLEVLTQEEKGHLWYIQYPVVDPNSNDRIVVATTRPETLFGDVAVAVNPDDHRYAHLIGHKLELPLTQRQIEIIADEHVDAAFGTGCVKVTPAHDFNDYEIGQRHKLAQINIFHLDATLNDQVPAAYRGLDRYVARKKVLQDLKELGLLERVEEKKIMVPRGDRSAQVVEPLLTNQWFVRTQSLATAAIQVVRDGHIQFIPENWTKTYTGWLEEIQDWCISRQLWWGHQIPAWYDDAGRCYVGIDETSVRRENKLGPETLLRRDEDVLDTWFSSALWPFTTLGWPEKTPEFKQFYPNTVLVTGFDIIFFWVARMIMLGIECTGEIPFRQVYVHGLVLDPDGKKMSKSKGNILDPIDLIDGIALDRLIEKRTHSLMQNHFKDQVRKKTAQQFPQGIPAYGTDALRFTFLAMASGNRNIRFDLKRIEGYRNFCNKLWNATRFLTTNAKGFQAEQSVGSTLAIDNWIEQALNQLLETLETYYANYRFDQIAQAVYAFVWHDYCDWYLEFCKAIQTSDEYPEDQKRANKSYQIVLLEKILCMLHPAIPFITEELWQELKPFSQCSETSILQRNHPRVSTATASGQKNAQEIEWIKTVIANIRKVRTEMKIAPQAKITLKVQDWTPQRKACFEKHQLLIAQLAQISGVEWLQRETPCPPAAIVLVETMRLLIPIEGLIDSKRELMRLSSEINKTSNSLQHTEKLLSNKNFSSRASAEVVQQTQKQLESLRTQLDLLKMQQAALQA